MLFIFHAKLKRGVQKYVSIKQRLDFVIKMDESSCQISATAFTLAKSYGSYSAVFSKILWLFSIVSISKTVCVKIVCLSE